MEIFGALDPGLPPRAGIIQAFGLNLPKGRANPERAPQSLHSWARRQRLTVECEDASPVPYSVLR